MPTLDLTLEEFDWLDTAVGNCDFDLSAECPSLAAKLAALDAAFEPERREAAIQRMMQPKQTLFGDFPARTREEAETALDRMEARRAAVAATAFPYRQRVAALMAEGVPFSLAVRKAREEMDATNGTKEAQHG